MTPSQTWFISMNWRGKKVEWVVSSLWRNEWKLSRQEIRGKLKSEKTAMWTWPSTTTHVQARRWCQNLNLKWRWQNVCFHGWKLESQKSDGNAGLILGVPECTKWYIWNFSCKGFLFADLFLFVIFYRKISHFQTISVCVSVCVVCVCACAQIHWREITQAWVSLLNACHTASWIHLHQLEQAGVSLGKLKKSKDPDPWSQEGSPFP